MATENIFKFVALRPPFPPLNLGLWAGYDKYGDKAKSNLHQQIEAIATGDKREKARELALNFLTTNQYMPFTQKEIHFIELLADVTSITEAKKLAETILGKKLEDYLKMKETVEKWDTLWDSLYAQSLLLTERPQDREKIYIGIRAIYYLNLLNKLKDSDKFIGFNEIKKIKFLIPGSIFPEKKPDSQQSDLEKREKKEVIDKFKKLHSELIKSYNTINDIKNVESKYRAVSQRQTSIIETKSSQIEGSTIQKFKLIETKSAIIQKPIQKKGELVRPIRDAVENVLLVVPPKKPWIYDTFGNQNLKTETKSFLKQHQEIYGEKRSIQIISSLKTQMASLVRNFFEETPARLHHYVADLPEYQWVTNNISVVVNTPAVIPPYIAPDSPTARGIKPLGIGDLLIVRQELQKYTPGEIAHVENVLKSEKKNRSHLRIRETEETVTIENEEIEENERDLQTTERFELHNEAQKTIASDMSIEAGVSVTASYGVITATTHGDFAFSESVSESTKSASEYAKDIIERSISRMFKRTREERIQRVLERIEEKNEHGFDNTGGPDHVTGIYRWLDKYYKVRIINYGRRMMIEFIIPEPAAFYIHTQNKKPVEGMPTEKPSPPVMYGKPLKPTYLDCYNYTDFVSQYNVKDVEPYPDEIIYVSTGVAEAPGAGGDKNVFFGKTAEKLKIPDGYHTLEIYGQRSFGGFTDKYIEILIAGEVFGEVSGLYVEGIIPISINGWGTDYNVNIVAECELKEEAIAAWQLKVYQSIMSAYQSALDSYNEQVAAAQIQAGINIQGKNPGFNRKIEQEELRKGALRILTNNFASLKIGDVWRSYEQFNAMYDNMQYGYPEFWIQEAQTEGKIIQFFEQAFEWNNMTYKFYPYFWGRKSKWPETFLKDDTDANFTDFLKAGAARIIVPVHPAYNEAILHFLHTKEIWNGGEPPTLDDPLFVSIVDELKSETDADIGNDLLNCSVFSGYPCLSDEWDVKVPTNLIYLQKDSVLPEKETKPR